MMKVYQVIL